MITSIRIEEKNAGEPNFWTIVKKKGDEKAVGRQEMLFQIYIEDRFPKPILKIVNVHARKFRFSRWYPFLYTCVVSLR